MCQFLLGVAVEQSRQASARDLMIFAVALRIRALHHQEVERVSKLRHAVVRLSRDIALARRICSAALAVADAFWALYQVATRMDPPKVCLIKLLPSLIQWVIPSAP